MNLKQFLKELADATKKRKIQWGTPVIRVIVPSPKYWQCPICFLCQVKTRKLFPNHEFKEAAKHIGLNPWAARVIAIAADEMWGNSSPTKKKLMKAIGLAI